MTLPVFLRQTAEIDVAAMDWYHSLRQGPSGEIRETVDDIIPRIADSPLTYLEVGPAAIFSEDPLYVLRYRSTLRLAS